MKLYIITYEGSTTIKKCVARYKALGYDPIIFMGKSIIKDKISYNTICYINYTNLLNSIDKKDDIIISEDDAWIIKKINIINKDEINWLGYWKKTTKQTLGSMLIYYPQSKLQHVSRQFNAKQPQHLDSFINKYLDFIIRPTPITREIQHNSIILEQYSKGTKTIRTHKYML